MYVAESKSRKKLTRLCGCADYYMPLLFTCNKMDISQNEGNFMSIFNATDINSALRMMAKIVIAQLAHVLTAQ